jgi:hypothetical protein
VTQVYAVLYHGWFIRMVKSDVPTVLYDPGLSVLLGLSDVYRTTFLSLKLNRLEDGGSNVHRNICILPHHYTASEYGSLRLETKASSLKNACIMPAVCLSCTTFHMWIFIMNRFKLTNWLHGAESLRSYSRFASQEMSHFLWNLKVHYRIHSSQSLVPTWPDEFSPHLPTLFL